MKMGDNDQLHKLCHTYFDLVAVNKPLVNSNRIVVVTT